MIKKILNKEKKRHFNFWTTKLYTAVVWYCWDWKAAADVHYHIQQLFFKGQRQPWIECPSCYTGQLVDLVELGKRPNAFQTAP